MNDFHNWEAWSPWAKLDPTAKATFEGRSAGIGAILRWAGNSEVGEGSMTITESRPSDLIRIKLEFLKPFAATNTAEFTFKPASNQTAVTWSMEGKNNLIAKAVCLFMNMDKMVGGQSKRVWRARSPWWKQRPRSSAATLDSGVVEFYYRNG